MTGSRVRGGGPAAAAAVVVALLTLPVVGLDFGRPAAPAFEGSFEWRLPLGFPLPAVPEDNPMSAAKVELGRRLFYDRRLSGNGTQACASCHQQERAFTDGLARAVGSTHEIHPRSSMSLANVAYNVGFGWADPNLDSLEEQALVPMLNVDPVELGVRGNEAIVLERLSASVEDRRRFAAAFPGEQEAVSLRNVVRAIAAFERTLISGDSPYDRYTFAGDAGALSAEALRGLELFFSPGLGCFECHQGFNLSAATTWFERPRPLLVMHNTGLYNLLGVGLYPPENTGLAEHTGRPADMGRFRAPTLRNVALTAPYMHDGSVSTLPEVLEHYAQGGRTVHSGPWAGVGRDNPFKNPRLQGFHLGPGERLELLAFLESLTDRRFVTDPRFSDPFAGER